MLRKLIEVALPLEAINKEAAREKSIRHGHPSTLHLWWARRPLAACRAVLFASLVDDPSSHAKEFPTEEAQEKERQRLFGIIEDLVKWENSNNEEVLGRARSEILKSTGGHPPPVLDPFCGGGSIPLEAQRLGLEAHASDLNPVAVLITKALIEIPPKFAGRAPVNPGARKKLDHSKTWRGAQGLAEDVRFYGHWMRDEAEKRIGQLYPNVKLPKQHGGGEATVIAWLWARTVNCPNPACGAQMPLVRSFTLSARKGEEIWAAPVIDKARKAVRFEIRPGAGKPLEGTVDRRGARCIVCGSPVPLNHVRAEGRAGRMSAQLMAIVVGGKSGRTYLSPNMDHEQSAALAIRSDAPDTDLPEEALGFRVQAYGFRKHRDLFTRRQLVALTTCSALVADARERVLADALAAAMPGDTASLAEGGHGANAYADAVITYLAFAVDKAIDRNTALCSWESRMDRMRNTFGRQTLSMVWDYTETNPFAGAGGDLGGTVESLCEVLDSLPDAPFPGRVYQLDAASTLPAVDRPMVSTDPPYYDNVGYADLSDFFYVWLRKNVGAAFPQLFSTVLVPKKAELVAAPARFEGDVAKAQAFFEDGLRQVFQRIREAQNPEIPLTVFYAFKQAESDVDETPVQGRVASTGWETMLEGLVGAGFTVRGTWPMRSELGNRPRARVSNALASSIVLVARLRSDSAPLATRKEFLAALKRELPLALKRLQHGNIAPVDLAQAAIGPGMAVFSRYSKVVEADGSRMPVRTALGLINQVLDDVLAEQESEFDADTRWALAWFEQHGMNDGPYGDAETLSKAKDTSVDALARDGLLEAKRGKVRLLRRDELPADWNPATDSRLTVWELTQHLIRRLEAGGESAAAELLRQVGSLGDVARDLAYRLYNLCERKGWAPEATAYNGLVTAWPELTRLASQALAGKVQGALFS